MIDNFFSTAPKKLPASRLDEWSKLIDPNVKVFFGDKLIFTNREEWLKDYNNPKGLSGDTIHLFVSRLQAYQSDEGAITVLEWSVPYDTSTIFHGVRPYQLVTYQFDLKQKMLKSVRFGERMTLLETTGVGQANG